MREAERGRNYALAGRLCDRAMHSEGVRRIVFLESQFPHGCIL